MTYHCSITRLRVRKLRYVIPFLLAASRCTRQASASPELLFGSTVSEFPFVYWTITIWSSKVPMMKYLGSGAHLKAMPKLALWCSEAHTTHFPWEQTVPPDLESCAVRLRTGKIVHVLFPTKEHESIGWKASGRQVINIFHGK